MATTRSGRTRTARSAEEVSRAQDEEVNPEDLADVSQLNLASTADEVVNDDQIKDMLDKGEEDSSDDDDDGEYSDLHRLVLQGMMSAGYLDAKRVKKLFFEVSKFLKCDIPTGTNFYPYIQKVVTEINAMIKMFDMVIKSATCEITGEKFYVFLVTVESPILKLQTHFPKVELDYFEKIIDQLLRKHGNFTICRMECLNMVSELDSRRGFTKETAEDFIDRMLSMQYFTKVYKFKDTEKEEARREYNLTLGFRTIREFEPIFRSVYPDFFATCCLCKTILLNGLKCPNCPLVIHRVCFRKFVKTCKSCVSCKAPWKDEKALVVRSKDNIEVSSPPGSSEASTLTGESSHASGPPKVNPGQNLFVPVSEAAAVSLERALGYSSGSRRRDQPKRRRVQRMSTSSESE